MRIVFFGTPAFAVPTLQRLLESPHEVVGVVTQPDRPRGLSGCVTTPTTGWRDASRASSVGTAKAGVPKNTMRSGATICRHAQAS